MCGRAPSVPDRSGDHRERRCPAGSAHGDGPRPSCLVRGRNTAEAEGFEPSAPQRVCPHGPEVALPAASKTTCCCSPAGRHTHLLRRRTSSCCCAKNKPCGLAAPDLVLIDEAHRLVIRDGNTRSAAISQALAQSASVPQPMAPPKLVALPFQPRQLRVLSDAELYAKWMREAEEWERTGRDQRRAESTAVHRVRNPLVRKAVLKRSKGRCENPRCRDPEPVGYTDNGDPILEVDHVVEHAKGAGITAATQSPCAPTAMRSRLEAETETNSEPSSEESPNDSTKLLLRAANRRASHTWPKPPGERPGAGSNLVHAWSTSADQRWDSGGTG